jgi:hypothetical protein
LKELQTHYKKSLSQLNQTNHTLIQDKEQSKQHIQELTDENLGILHELKVL